MEWFHLRRWSRNAEALSIPTGELFMRDKRVLVLINPVSGEGHAHRIWCEVVAPIFEKVGIKSISCLLTRAGHARSVLADYDLPSFDGIVMVTGDGVVGEVVCGLADLAQGRHDDAVIASIRTVFLGVIPAGRSNSVANSLFGNDPFTAARTIALGSCKDVALTKVLGGPRSAPVWGCLGMQWGLFADHQLSFADTKSRAIRILKTVYAPAKVVTLCKSYVGSLCFEVSPLAEWQRQKAEYRDPSNLPVANRLDSFSGDWRQIDARFLVCSILNLPFEGHLMLAPYVECDAGSMDIVVVRDLPHHRVNLIKFLVRVENGKHLSPSSPVELYKARSAILFPDGGGSINVSGDQYSDDLHPVSIDVHPRAARFCF